MELSFDVLNYLAGYHPLNNHEEGANALHDIILVVGRIRTHQKISTLYSKLTQMTEDLMNGENTSS